MIDICRTKSATLMTILALLAALPLTTGCANRSAINFSRSDLFDRSQETSDLDVRESSASAQWFESYDTAHSESLRTGKPLMMVFSGSDWCGPCIQLKNKVFESSKFKRWAVDNVVLLELDFPKSSHQDPKIKSQNQRLSAKYNIKGYPTVLFINADGDVMGKQGHGTDAAKWIASAERKLR